MDTFELSSSSLLVPTISFNKVTKTRHRSETKPRFLRSEEDQGKIFERFFRIDQSRGEERAWVLPLPRALSSSTAAGTVPFSGWSCRWSRRRFRAGSPLNRLRLQ